MQLSTEIYRRFQQCQRAQQFSKRSQLRRLDSGCVLSPIRGQRDIERPRVLGSSFKYTSPTYNFEGADVEAKMYQQIERRAQIQVRDGKAVFYTEAQEKDLVFRQRELDVAARRHGAHVDPAGAITINSAVLNDYKRQVDLYERQATAERAAPTTSTPATTR